MDVEAVDLGGELVEPVQGGFACAPVVFARPVIGELTGVATWDALSPVVDALGLGPSGAGQPLLQVGEISVGNRNAKRTYRGHGAIVSRPPFLLRGLLLRPGVAAQRL